MLAHVQRLLLLGAQGNLGAVAYCFGSATAGGVRIGKQHKVAKAIGAAQVRLLDS